MALTHAQRTSMFDTLAEVMGQDDAETLMEHLPPSGWGNVASKEDLRAGLAEVNAAMVAGFAELKEVITSGLAQAAVERAEIRTETATELAQIRTETATELAQIRTEAATERAQIRTEAATERAEIIRRQAWHLYVVVSTIVVASISIWIALLTQPGIGN